MLAFHYRILHTLDVKRTTHEENYMSNSPKSKTAGHGTHTPGPWRVVTDQGNHLVTSRSSNICRLYRDHEADHEANANARLIAAAPELLAALKGLMKAIAPDGSLKGLEKYFVEPVRVADLVIRKAEGRGV